MSRFSPVSPDAATTASLLRDTPFPSGVSDIREAYLVKRRSFTDSFGGFTFYLSRMTRTGFSHPAGVFL